MKILLVARCPFTRCTWQPVKSVGINAKSYGGILKGIRESIRLN